MGEEHAMALGTSLTLSEDSATDVDTNTNVYALRAADLDRSIFSVAGLTLPVEKKLTVSHETRSGGVSAHLVRLDFTETDTELVPATGSVYMVIVRPPSTALTNAIIIKRVNQLVDFIVEGGSNANVTALLNRET
jgi:hypothetical protein